MNNGRSSFYDWGEGNAAIMVETNSVIYYK